MSIEHLAESSQPPGKTRAWHILGLVMVLALAAFLSFFRLEQEGYANLYYAAAVRSMLSSWRNFFFVSFDAGGFVSVDKPPLGLWVQAFSAMIFGFHGWSLLLPQALAGVLSVGLLYYLVARIFGPAAGLIAGLVLALTPISVAANRNNTMDSLLVLTSLLAAWTASLAVDRGRLRWLLLCALLVGVGFNIKMLQAYLVLPAFFLGYLLAAPIRWWRRLLHLATATVLLGLVSFSWAFIVDLTPTDQRPFVGSSKDNTVMELVLGHNGAARLGQLAGWLGLGTRPSGRPYPGLQPPAGIGPVAPPIQPPAQAPYYPPQVPGQSPSSGVRQPGLIPGLPPAQAPYYPPQTPRQLPSPGDQPHVAPIPGLPPNPPPAQAPLNPPQGSASPPLRGASPYPPGNQASGPQPGGLGDETGKPGLFRLFNRQLAGQIAWFLPLALLCLLPAAWQMRPKWPLTSQHQALLMWALWLLPQGVFFSFAGLFHRYYLEMMVPAIAALVGAGLVAMWNDLRRARSLASVRGWLLPLLLVGTAGIEVIILDQFPEWARWLTPLVLGLTLLAVLGLVGLFLARRTRWTGGFVTLGLIALLIAPTVWAGIPVWYGGDSGLPFAGPELLERHRFGGTTDNSRLVSYLLENRDGEEFILATLSSQTAAPIILATGEPVMALGGFNGGDHILTVEELEARVANGEVRFFLLPWPPRLPELPNPPRQSPLPPGQQPPIPVVPPINQPLPPRWNVPGLPYPSPVYPQGYTPVGPLPQEGQSGLIIWVRENCRLVPDRLWGSSTGAPAGPMEDQGLWDCGS